MTSPSPSTIALDIDVGRIHAWSTVRRRVCFESPRPPWDEILSHDLVLVETASHIVYDRKKDGRPMTKKEKLNRYRWAIFCMAITGEIFGRMSALGRGDRMLVSPSSSWTLGHSEELRDDIAGVVGQDNHDIRQCRCMIYYHSTNPKAWSPYLTYVDSFDHSQRKSHV